MRIQRRTAATPRQPSRRWRRSSKPAATRLARSAEREPRPTNHELRTTNYELRTTNHELRTTNHERRTTNDEPRTTNYDSTREHVEPGADPREDVERREGSERAADT